LHSGAAREIAIAGEYGSSDTLALLSAARNGYRPLRVLALGAADGGNAVDGVGSFAAG
jgi:hypothetical protein